MFRSSWRNLLRSLFCPKVRTYRRKPVVLRRRSRLIVESLEDRVTPTVNAMIDAQHILQITYVGDDTANLAVDATGTMLSVTDQNNNPVIGSPFMTANINGINIVGNTNNNDVASFNSDFLFANNNLQTITEKQLTSVHAGGTGTVKTITTTGDQTYNDAFLLATDVDLNAQDVSFKSTVTGMHALEAKSTGTTTFGGEVGVGANNALTKLTLDAGGSTAINTDQITTTGDQDYRNAVTLGAQMGGMNVDTTLASMSGTVKFSTANSTLDGASADGDGAHGLAIMGNAALSAAAGGTTKLKFLTTAMGGTVSLVNVTTTGKQDYAATTSITLNGTYTTNNNPFTVDNPAILGGATTINTTGGDVTFKDKLDATTADVQTLTLTAGSGTIHFTGVVGGTTPLGTVTINAANKVLADQNFSAAALNQTVASTSDVTFSGKITTAGATGMAGGNITLNSGGMLTAKDSISAVGGAAIMQGLAGGSVSLTGTSVSVTSIDTEGSAATAASGLNGGAAGAITLTATTMTTGAVSVTTMLNATGGAGAGTGAQGAGGAITLVADALTLPVAAGTLKGNGTIAFQPIAATDNIGIGDGAAGTLTIGTADLNTVADGFTQITIGRADGSGAVAVNQVTFNAAVLIETPNAGGSITVTSNAPAHPGIMSLDGDDMIALKGSGMTTHLTANIVTNGAAIQINDSVELDANILLDTTNGGIATGAAIGITGAVNADMAAQNRTFILTAGTGNIELDGAVGTTQALGSLTTNGTGMTTLKGGAVTTNMGQTYNEAVLVSTATTFTPGAAATAKFASTLTSIGPAQDVMVSGNAEFDNAVTGLNSLKITGTTAINTTTISTTADQTYQNAVTLGADVILTSTTGTVNFSTANSTVNGNTTDGARSLTISGNSAFNGIVGGIAGGKLKALSVSGTTAIDTTAITTTNAGGGTGNQSYSQAVTLGATANLTATGATVAFGSTLNDTIADGTHDLTITGNATFAGVVGGAANGKLRSLTVTGNTAINTSAITTTNAGGGTGAQNYMSDVTLGAAATLTTLTATGGTVAFGGKLNDTVADGTHDLQVSGNATFADVVGGQPNGKLKSLTVTGTAGINTTTITTTGTQSYGQTATLGANATLTGSAVSFNAAVAGNTHSLDVEANATFGTGAGDSVSGVTTLKVSGNTTINAGSITTSGTQSYGGAETLGVAPAIALDSTAGGAAGADITISGAISDDATASSLTLKAGSNGNVQLNGTGATPIGGSLTATANNITLQTAKLTTVGSVSLTAQNTIAVNAALDAGASTVSIMANQDGDGAEGLTQSASIKTTNDTTGAIRIVVNTAVGGTGTASLNAVTTGTGGTLSSGTINVNANGSSITQAASTLLTATNLVLRAATGIGTIFSQVSNLAFKNSMSVNATTPSKVVVSNTGALTLAALDGLTQSENDGGDVTLCTTGTTADLMLNTPLLAMGTVAGSTPTVRLSVERDLSQSGTNLITTTDLGVIAGGNISLGLKNHVTGKIALEGGNTTFQSASSITIGAITSADCFTTGASGIDGGNGDKTICTDGDLSITSTITTTGTVRLMAGGQVTQTSGGVITAAQLGVQAKNGILLDTAVNLVSNLFAANNSTMNDVKLRDSAATLKIGTVIAADCFVSNAVGVVSAANVTIGNTTGDLVIGNGNAGEGINAKGTGFVRLSAQAGAVSQVAVGVISGVNLGVFAQNGVTLDAVPNMVTGQFAAKDTMAGSVKFRNGGGGLTIGTVASDSPAFSTTVVGVVSPVDVTIDNTTGNLAIGNGNTGEGITANTAMGTVRLAADAGAVTQVSVGTISSANLGVIAQSGVTLDQTINTVNTLFAMNDMGSNAVAFRDQAASLTIGTVAKDMTSPGFTTAVVGVKGPNDVTLNNVTGNLVIGNGNAGEGITAGAASNVRLKLDAGAVSQVSVGIISGANLGVQAATGIALNGAVNTVTGLVALSDGTSGTVKLRNASAQLTVGTVVLAAGSPASITTVHGVTSPSDVTLNNTGALVIGNGNAGEGVTTGASSTARLNSVNMSVSQVAVGVINTANLGVRAGQGIGLDQATNRVTGNFAANGAGGDVKFTDDASTATTNTLTIASVAGDGTDFTQTRGVTATGDAAIRVGNVTTNSGNLTVGTDTSFADRAESVSSGDAVSLLAGKSLALQQLVKSGNGKDIALTSGGNLSGVALKDADGTSNSANVGLDAGAGKVAANVGMSPDSLISSETTRIDYRINAANGATFQAQVNANIRDMFQIRPSEGAKITVVGEKPTSLPGDSYQPILEGAQVDTLKTLNFPDTDVRNNHGIFTFKASARTAMPIEFFGIESLTGVSLAVTSVQTTNTSFVISIQGELQGAAGTSGRIENSTVGTPQNLTSLNINTFVLSPAFASPAANFSTPRVAIADVNGDGIPDLIIVPGPGLANAPLVTVVDGNGITAGRVIDPKTDVLSRFFAFDPNFRGGMFVAAGDLDGTGKASIVASLDKNGSPLVRVFNSAQVLGAGLNPRQLVPNGQFLAYDDSFRGGVRVAVGDVTGQPPIIVTAPGAGAALPVKIFNPTTLQQSQSFFPYGTSFSEGILIAVANLDASNPTNDILTGPGAGEPLIEIFSGPTYTKPSTSFVAFRSGTGTELSSGFVGTFHANSPVFGVSSVAFGAIDLTNGTTRQVVVASGIGQKVVQATVTPQPGHVASSTPAKRSMFVSKRAPRGVNIAGRR